MTSPRVHCWRQSGWLLPIHNPRKGPMGRQNFPRTAVPAGGTTLGSVRNSFPGQQHSAGGRQRGRPRANSAPIRHVKPLAFCFGNAPAFSSSPRNEGAGRGAIQQRAPLARPLVDPMQVCVERPERCRPRQQQRFLSKHTGTLPNLARAQTACARGRAHSGKHLSPSGGVVAASPSLGDSMVVLRPVANLHSDFTAFAVQACASPTYAWCLTLWSIEDLLEPAVWHVSWLTPQRAETAHK